MGDTVVCEDAKLALWRRRAKIAQADDFWEVGIVAGRRSSISLLVYMVSKSKSGGYVEIECQQGQDAELGKEKER